MNMANLIVQKSICEIKHHSEKILIPLIDQNLFKQLVIYIGTLNAYLFGAQNTSIIYILLVLIFIDLATGVLAAVKLNIPVKSNKLASTAYKLVIYFSLIATAKLCGESLGFEKIEKLVIAFYIAVEAYSIIENADKLGVPIPELFRKAIKGRIEKDTDKDIKN